MWTVRQHTAQAAPATGAAIPIPDNIRYGTLHVRGTAAGTATVELQVSIDGGITWAPLRDSFDGTILAGGLLNILGAVPWQADATHIRSVLVGTSGALTVDIAFSSRP